MRHLFSLSPRAGRGFWRGDAAPTSQFATKPPSPGFRAGARGIRPLPASGERCSASCSLRRARPS
ncbi:hypothetical protein A33M_4135 [Rhodovulum sp. PH10]|nr:hypothetical protein A33M_4135 [Rhodovulum sp. PH10]